MYRFFDGIFRHGRASIVLLGALLAVAIGIGFYLQQRDARAMTANNALFSARAAVEKELKGISAALKPAETSAASKDAKKLPEPVAADVAHQKFDVDAKLPEGAKALRGVVEKHSGTRAAADAAMALGQLYLQHGQPEKAGDWFQKAVDGSSGALEKALAYSALGYMKENSASYAEAIQFFEKALNLGQGSLKGDLLMAIARCQEEMKDAAKARATYEKIIQQLPNSEYAKNAETYKNLLE